MLIAWCHCYQEQNRDSVRKEWVRNNSVCYCSKTAQDVRVVLSEDLVSREQRKANLNKMELILNTQIPFFCLFPIFLL